MENSIEENIKEIECFFKRNYFVNYDWTTIHRNSMANLEDSIEDILSDYKRVLKENEELKNAINVVNKEKADWIRAYQEEKDKQIKLLKSRISIQKVKDKIEEYKNILKTCNKAKDIDRIKAINERILELEELLEGRR